MHAIAHGIDLVEIARFERMLRDHPDRSLDRLFTPGEQERGSGTRRAAQHLAARFAAKEATLKALGTGWRYGIAWTDISVETDAQGAPSLVVTGKAAEFAGRAGITGWLVSLSHTDTHAMASVIGLGGG